MAANGPRTVAAILVAAGSGSRLGAKVPKAFARIGDQTLLERAARRFAMHYAVGQVIVVVPAAQVEKARDLLDDATAEVARFDAIIADALAKRPIPGFTPKRTLGDAPAMRVVAGGATRQQSVMAGLAVLAPEIDAVLVHDVARPFVSKRVIRRVLDGLEAGADGVVPVLPVHDTIRRVDADGELAGVVDRTSLVAVQTPQGFRRDALERAHAAGAALAVTDDAALVEAMGGTVVAVPGDEAAFKITRPWDLKLAEALDEAGALDD